MTEAELEEWRDHPVSRMACAALRASLDREIAAGTRAYWAGEPWPEAERLAFLRKQELWEDIFESTLADFEAALRQEEDGTDEE